MRSILLLAVLLPLSPVVRAEETFTTDAGKAPGLLDGLRHLKERLSPAARRAQRQERQRLAAKQKELEERQRAIDQQAALADEQERTCKELSAAGVAVDPFFCRFVPTAVASPNPRAVYVNTGDTTIYGRIEGELWAISGYNGVNAYVDAAPATYMVTFFIPRHPGEAADAPVDPQVTRDEIGAKPAGSKLKPDWANRSHHLSEAELRALRVALSRASASSAGDPKAAYDYFLKDIDDLLAPAPTAAEVLKALHWEKMHCVGEYDACDYLHDYAHPSAGSIFIGNLKFGDDAAKARDFGYGENHRSAFSAHLDGTPGWLNLWLTWDALQDPGTQALVRRAYSRMLEIRADQTKADKRGRTRPASFDVERLIEFFQRLDAAGRERGLDLSPRA